jgi:hypothetical protein
MNGLTQLLAKTNRLGVKFNEEIDGLETSEIYYSHEGSIKFKTGKISNGDVVPWLNQRGQVYDSNSDDDNKSRDIVRVVWVRRKIKFYC